LNIASDTNCNILLFRSFLFHPIANVVGKARDKLLELSSTLGIMAIDTYGSIHNSSVQLLWQIFHWISNYWMENRFVTLGSNFSNPFHHRVKLKPSQQQCKSQKIHPLSFPVVVMVTDRLTTGNEIKFDDTSLQIEV
jgi:hypothetical protein